MHGMGEVRDEKGREVREGKIRWSKGGEEKRKSERGEKVERRRERVGN